MIAQLDSDLLRLRPWKLWPRLLAYTMFEGRPLTTRGRWINPAVFAGYRVFHALPLNPRDAAPIFIYGTGRAGTTVLGKVLGLHPQLGFLNEPKALWQAALGDDDLIGSYSARMGRYRMTGEDADAKKIRRLARAYAAFQHLSRSKRVVDKYPELIFRDGFVRAAFPKARKIVLLRDGWQTAASVEAWSRKYGRPESREDWWGKSGRKWALLCRDVLRPDPYFYGVGPHLSRLGQTDRAALEWVATTRESIRLLRDTSRDDLLAVGFEELTANPAAVFSRILAFAGLPDDPKTIAYAASHLRPQKHYPRPALHPEVAHLLTDTMNELGTARLEDAA